jgi:prepilin-type N-terminal cleavage/methylation domain-containing protein/prepilin-type processing-associated H-X9-DG protein
MIRPIRRPFAFTLIELLVVIAIIAVLIALLVPAVQKVREAASRAQCQNNLKQIGLGLHGHLGDYKAFPDGHIMDSGGSYQRGSWVVPLLPYIEQKALFDSYNRTINWWNAGNQTPRGIKVAIFLCPSDGDAPIFNTSQDFGFRGNYVANAGLGLYVRNGTATLAGQTQMTVIGPFIHGKRATIAELRDGTSNTAAVTEIRKSPNNDSRGALFADAGSVQYTHDFLPNEAVADATERCVTSTDMPCTSPGSNGPHRLTARSYHTGGVNVLLFDGSVRFVSQGIDRPTWQAIGSMAGNETLGLTN